MSLVIQFVQSRTWAILQEHLELIAAIADRDIEAREDVLEAIEKKWGTPVAGTVEATVRDNIAIVPIAGPLFRYANLFTQISGATSYERLSQDIGRVMSDPNVERLILDINSPGGEVDGVAELADLIASYRGQKPVTAFISNLGASGAYWIAAAAQEIVVAKTALVGSIGAVMQVIDRSGQDEKRGIRRMEFVSSFSPDKRLKPFSDNTDEAVAAQAKLQNIVDRTGQVFVEMVASYRGVTEESIKATKGGLFVGADAVDAGLADRMGTLEGLIDQFTGRSAQDPANRSLAAVAGGLDTSVEENTMDKTDSTGTEVAIVTSVEQVHPDLVAAIKQGAKTEERERILAIYDIDAAGFDAIKREKMADPKGTSGSAAQAILGAKGEQEKRRAEAVKDGLDADEKDVQGVESTALPAAEPDSEEALAASVLKYMPQATQAATENATL